MVHETEVQSQVESYQRLKKRYLMSSCLTVSIIRYGSRVKLDNPGKGVAPPLHVCVIAVKTGGFSSSSTMIANFTKYITRHLKDKAFLPLLKGVYALMNVIA